MTPALSIVMPAHNEGPHIEASVREWLDAVSPLVPDVELIVVDDRSTDDTGTRLARMAQTVPNLRVLTTPTNVGHGPAVRLGLLASRGLHVFQTDSDRQHAPADFQRLWDARHRAPFVFGVRERRADGPVRAVISSALRLVNLLTWGYAIRDANCPFKLMASDAMRALLAEIPADTFIPMVMVSVLARYRGYEVVEVPVQHFPRSAGQQSLRGLGRWLRVGTACTRQMVMLRLSTRRTSRAAAGKGHAA